jgi:hypothetical protein
MTDQTLTAPAAMAPTARIDRTRRGAGAVCLVGGAAGLVLARTLTNAGGTPAERLSQVAPQQTTITASALLAVLGFAALIPGFLTVAGRIRERGAVLATVGAGLCVVGFVGFAVLAAIDAFPTVAAARVGGGTGPAYLSALDGVGGLALIDLPAVVGFFAGPFLVALAAWRARLAPAWLPWLVLAGLVLQPVGLALAGPGAGKHVLDIACQAVLLIALVVLARRALGTPTR